MHKQSTLFPDPIEEARRCLYCEKPLVRREREQYENFKRRKTCDRICGGKYAGQRSTAAHVDVECEYCLKGFSVTEKLIEKRRREGKRVRFCSNACAFAFRRMEPAQPKVCDACGLEFSKPNDIPLSRWKLRRFCSPECRHVGHAAYWSERRAEYLDAGEKTCTKCGEIKLLDQFLASPHHPDALRAKCVSCLRQEKRNWYWEDPEAARALARVHMRKNPEARRAYQRQYIEENREQLRAKWRAYHAANRGRRNRSDRARRAAWTPEQRAEKYRRWNRRRVETGSLARWQEKNREAIRENGRLWRRLCHRKNADKQMRRIAHMRRVSVERVSRGNVIARWGAMCYLCDRSLESREITLDHVRPLSRGGQHSERNLRPCCQSCNSKKSNKTPDELEAMHPEMAQRVRAHIIQST